MHLFHEPLRFRMFGLSFVKGQFVCTCTACGEKIVNVSKPRGHMCQHH